MPLDLSKNAYLLGDDGWYRTSFQRIAPPDRAIEVLAQDSVVHIPNVFLVNNLPVMMAVKRAYRIYTVQLPKLSLKTTFSLQDGFLRPEFYPRQNEMGFIYSESYWTPPANMKMYFSIRIDGRGVQCQTNYAYLYVRHATVDGNFKLILPNQFSDGRICLGNRALESLIDSTHQGLFQSVLGLLDRSVWNLDQLPDNTRMERARSMMKIHPVTGESGPYDNSFGDWTTFLARINTTTHLEAMP